MPSGVVFVAILVIWAVILAPRAVKLYERTSTYRTTKRFSSAMSVLGSGKSVARVAVDTARSGARVLVDTRDPMLVRGQVQAAVRAPRPSPTVQRRRRVVAVGAGLLALAVVAVFLGLLPWWAAPLAAGPLVAFLGACAFSASQQRRSRVDITPLRPAGEVHSGGHEVVHIPIAPQGAAMGVQSEVVVFGTRRARRAGLRAGSWTQARILEAELAIAATYTSTEEELGLDRYVASPSAVDGEPYLRAANE